MNATEMERQSRRWSLLGMRGWFIWNYHPISEVLVHSTKPQCKIQIDALSLIALCNFEYQHALPGIISVIGECTHWIYPSTFKLGPLHTRAKSCDHEIVRAQKKVSKGRPNTPPISRSVKSYVIGCSTKCYFNEFLFMRVLTPSTIK